MAQVFGCSVILRPAHWDVFVRLRTSEEYWSEHRALNNLIIKQVISLADVHLFLSSCFMLFREDTFRTLKMN